MGRHILKQPNGLYCVYSTITDNVIYYDLTREDWLNIRAEEEKERITKDINEIFQIIERGEKPYGHFTMTFEQMLENIKTHHGYEEMIKVKAAILS